MYQDFYQMKAEAFINQPLPEIFFDSGPHKKAWEYLVHGIDAREQFLLLCGDYGIGKTTLCIRLTQAMKESGKIPFLFISTPTFSYTTLLARIAERLQISLDQEHVSAIENMIFRYFEDRGQKDGLTLIIDDVQDMDISTMNQLRLLANFNIEGFFPIRLLLFSHFSFIEKLKLDIMQPLNQRIRRRHYLQRLSFEETREYIYFRLVKAGSQGIPSFEDDAIQRIFAYSNGVPRSINNICDCCLIAGARHGLTVIDDSVVLEAIRYIEGKTVSLPEKITDESSQGNDLGYHPGNYGSDAQPPGGWGAGAGLFYRQKAKSGPHKLSKLGDFLDNIWVNINLRAANQNPRTFVLCGANRSVGTTFISFHLALSLSQERNMNVLYVDASLDAPHQPVVIPNMNARPGLAAFCEGHQSIDSIIQRTEYKNLSVVTSDTQEFTGTGNSGTGSNKGRSVKEFVDYCSAHFDATIIDAQPPMEHPSTITLAKAVDQTILISRYGVSRREVCQHTIDKLKENNIAIAGLIINERQYPLPEYIYKLLG